MPKTYIKKTKPYNQDAVMKAFEAVMAGTLTRKQACHTYGVASSTLFDKLKGRSAVDSKPGRNPALTLAIETKIVEMLLFIAEWGYTVEKREVTSFVKDYLDKLGKNVAAFKDNLPSKDWTYAFFQRNPELSERIANNKFKRKRAQVSAEILDEFFNKLKEHIEDVPPGNIFNYNESNLSDDPSKIKMIFKRGTKYPHNVISHSKSSISFMMCTNAVGVVLPPFVVYKATRLYSAWTTGGPAGRPYGFCSGCCCAKGVQYSVSRSGWFDAECFDKWFFKIFMPHVTSIPGTKVLLGDNLSSHFTPRVLETCIMHNIKFICFPPNATHLLQPLDVAYFGPLKSVWKKMLLDWKRRNVNASAVQKPLFPGMLKQLFASNEMVNHGNNATSGFASCGLVPYYPQRCKEKLEMYHREPNNSLGDETKTEDILSNNDEQLQEDDDVVIKTEEFEDDEEIGLIPTRADQNFPFIEVDEINKSWMVFIEEEEDSDIKDEQMEDQQQNSSLSINSPDRNDELLDDFSSDYDEQTDEESDVEEIDALTKASYEIPEDLQNLLNKNESGFSKTDINRRWAKKEMASSLFRFSVHRGPNESSFANCNNPMDFFLQFFDDSIIKHICFQSNFYAAQKSIFLDLHKEEFLAFLGINMVMSYVKLPSFEHYWSEAVDFKQDFISSHMSKDRFMTILSNLHLNENSTIRNHKGEKLYKIEPFVSKLKERFKNLYFPEREISVDGFTIPSKGESSINPLKPGYKMWCLGDSSGYVSNFDIFSSRQLQEINKNRNIYGLGGSIVLNLSIDYLGKCYRLFFDKFFSSFELLERLKLEHTYACGTIGGSGKDFPYLDPDDSLHRGEFDYRSTTKRITVYKWKDVKSIHLISNYHGIKKATVVRKRKSGVKEAVPCPEVVLDYNKYTVGIDKRNSFQSSYGTNRKNMKWWHHLFFYLVDVTVINSYVIYCQTKHYIPFIDFKRQLSVALVNKVKISECNKKRKR